MKRVLPWLSLIPALALVWQMFVYFNNQRIEDRKERRAWERSIDVRLASLDSFCRAEKDTAYLHRQYTRIVDEALATAESRIYRLRHPLPEGEPRLQTP